MLSTTFMPHSYSCSSKSSGKQRRLAKLHIHDLSDSLHSNTDSMTQRHELQRVYEWFCLNKPLIKSKTKLNQRKPKVSIRNCDRADHPALVPFPELERPQTAPASLYQVTLSETINENVIGLFLLGNFHL